MARTTKPKSAQKAGKSKPAAKAKTRRASPASKPAPRTVKSVRGDTYIAKDIGDKAVVAQGKSQVTYTNQEGAQSAELAALFQKVYQQIEARPPSAAATKEDITETVQKIENEVKENGEKANETRLQLWVDFLNKMAPDIVDVILASLGGPVSAATAILKKVAERARQPAATA